MPVRPLRNRQVRIRCEAFAPGAQNFGRVRDTLALAIRFSVLWSVGIALFLVVTGKYIAGLFSDDPKVIETARLFFIIVPFSYALSNLLRGWASAFNAMGKPHFSFIMSSFELVFLMLPAVWIGYALGGVTGLFFAMAGVNVIAGLTAHVWGIYWCKNLPVISNAAPAAEKSQKHQ